VGRKRKRTPGPYILDLTLLRERLPCADRYPFSLPVVRHLTRLELHPKITFLVGENGAGKSTLIEALAVACDLNPEGGSANFNFATRASHSQLENYLRLGRVGVPPDSFFLRAESLYNVATEIEGLGSNLTRWYGGVSLHDQSHGESFFAVFQNRFGFRQPGRPPVPGLYLLDEPEAALSPGRQIEFLGLLHQYCQEGSQFVIATHSPIIMAYPDAWIYVLSQNGIDRTSYVETEHYRVTRSFLNHPQKALSILMAEDDAE
jgi:predicted ATPase